MDADLRGEERGRQEAEAQRRKHYGIGEYYNGGSGGGGGGGDGGLGTGALVGVIIVVLVAGVGVLGLVFWLYRADKLRCCVRGDVEASTRELEVGTIRNPAVAEKDML